VASAISALFAAPARAPAATTPLEVQGGQYTGYDGTQLFYRRTGKGPTVILLHRFLSDGPRNWFNTGVAQAICDAGLSVVAPDARAQGLSAASPGPDAKDVLAMDVEALIRTLGLKSFHLFGYAIGARTAVRLMVRGARPERCILSGVGITGVVNVERIDAPNIETIRAGRNARDPRLGILVQSAIKLQKLKPAALIAVLKSEVSTSRAELAQLHTPILVMNAAKDNIEGSPAELAAALPEAAVLRLPGDHFSVLRDPKLAQTAAAFLKSREPPARFAAAAAL